MKTFVVIALIASVSFAADQTYVVTDCTHPEECPRWATEGYCVKTPSYMCKCCRENCPGITCPGDASTASTGKPNGQTCKKDVDCASTHCCGIVTDIFGLATGTCRECCEDRHCASGQICEVEGLLSWKNTCKERKRFLGIF